MAKKNATRAQRKSEVIRTVRALTRNNPPGWKGWTVSKLKEHRRTGMVRSHP